MADLTPTTDSKKPAKKTLIILGAAGVAVIVYFYYRKKNEEGAPTQQNPYLAQSFIPVTAENVGGVGTQGGGSIGGGIGNTEGESLLAQAQKENTEFLTNYLRSERESRKEEQENIFNFYKQLSEGTKSQTGGGAPGEGQKGTSAGSGGGGEGATKTTQPGSIATAASCPSGWKWNPAKGKPGIHSCYHISRERAKKPGYVIHGYQDGTEVESR